ncbi:helicase RepA family protein [Verrucomicrobia bacterium]|nr:helicase RepA family protein [Verrucomicrobiota bacterium]
MPDPHQSFSEAFLRPGFFADAPTPISAVPQTVTEQLTEPQVLVGHEPPPADVGALPPWTPFNAFPRQHELIKPPLLVDGMLHQGSKMVLAGPSKGFKTMALMDQGLSIATGTEFWGRETTQGTVLFIDFELTPVWAQDRLWTILKGKGLSEPPESFLYWPLRGKCYDPEVVLRVLEERVDGIANLRCIYADPYYKLSANLDENHAGAVTSLLLALEQFSERTKASIVFSHHFNKAGYASGQGGPGSGDHVNKMSGSSSFARDPDSIITMSKHPDEASCMVIEGTMRNLRSPEPFVIEFDYPVFKIRDDLEAIPQRRQHQGGPSKPSPEQVLSKLTDAGMMTQKEWQDAATAMGLSIPEFESIVGKLRGARKIYLARNDTGEVIWKPEEEK